MLRYAIVGFGGIAEHHHLRRMCAEIGYELAGIYDTDPERRKLASRHGITVYKKYSDIANDPSVDAVLIATPNDYHVTYTEYFAKAKKHIISEKPAACTLAQFDRMARAAEQNGIVLTVHQNRRWDSDYLAIKRIIDSGILGEIHRIESNVCGANGIPDGWRKQKKHGGGMMLDWGVHLIDQVCMLLPAKITTLYCDYTYRTGFEVDDSFYLDLTFEDDIEVRIVVETNNFCARPRWLIMGSKGTAVIENWDLDGEIVLGQDTDEEIKGIAAGNGFTRTMANRPESGVRRYEIPKAGFAECDFYQNFAAACCGEAVSHINLQEVRRVMIIMELAAKSAAKKSVIKQLL